MCLISLSLSRVLEMSRSWCIAGFVNIVGSYGVYPLYLVVMNWVFPFEISLLSDWILLWIWEHLIYIVQLNTRGDNGVSYWFTWYMFWHSTRGFPRWHWGNLCIGVDARSCLCFSDRNVGALFEVLLCWLDESEIVWCISYNHAHGYLRWQWSI